MITLRMLIASITLNLSTIFLESAQKQTICLNMIVKNESTVICKCLESVKPLIDHWVIVDTGSTDGTQDVIKKFMQDIPGELHERSWVNFEHNRNEALVLAKGKADYILIMDADDYLVFSKSFVMPYLEKDFYLFPIEEDFLKYSRTQLIKDQLNWKWYGVLHEYLYADHAISHDQLNQIIYKRTGDGARSKDPLKFHKDIQVLEEALSKEPENERYRFYLAQSYMSVDHYEKAIENYQKRVDLKKWDQEVFYSLLQIAIAQELLKKPSKIVIDGYLRAYSYRPSRAEPLYYLASYYRKKEDYQAGYEISKKGLNLPMPKDILFVEGWIYDYGLLFEHSICAYWIGKYKEAEKASMALLNKSSLPANYQTSNLYNLKWIKEKIAESDTALKQALLE